MTPQVTPECPNEAEAARGRMDIVNLICTKRDGHELKDAEIDWIMDAYVHGAVADEQVSALLMAVFWRGLSVGELSRWTSAIIASGEKMDLSGLTRPTVDKHSTGGVGDKVSLILVPLSRPAEPPCPSFLAVASVTREGLSTSWTRSPGGAQSCRTTRCSLSSRRSAA